MFHPVKSRRDCVLHTVEFFQTPICLLEATRKPAGIIRPRQRESGLQGATGGKAPRFFLHLHTRHRSGAAEDPLAPSTPSRRRETLRAILDCGPGDAGTTVQWKGDAPDCLSAKLRHHQSGSPGSGPLTNPTPAEPLPFSLLPRRLTLRRTSSSRRLRAAISPHFDPGTYAVSSADLARYTTPLPGQINRLFISSKLTLRQPRWAKCCRRC